MIGKDQEADSVGGAVAKKHGDLSSNAQSPVSKPVWPVTLVAQVCCGVTGITEAC